MDYTLVKILVVCVVASLIGFFLFQILPEEIIKVRIRRKASMTIIEPDAREEYIKREIEKVDKVYTVIGEWGTGIIVLFMLGPLFCPQVFP